MYVQYRFRTKAIPPSNQDYKYWRNNLIPQNSEYTFEKIMFYYQMILRVEMRVENFGKSVVVGGSDEKRFA